MILSLSLQGKALGLNSSCDVRVDREDSNLDLTSKVAASPEVFADIRHVQQPGFYGLAFSLRLKRFTKGLNVAEVLLSVLTIGETCVDRCGAWTLRRRGHYQS